MKIKEVMSKDIVAVRPSDTVEHAAKKMRDKKVGTVMVVNEKGIQGMVTDRAIVTKVIAKRGDPSTLTIKEIMTTRPITCNENSDLLDTIKIIGNKKVRRLPVVNDNKELVGVVSMADVAREMRGCMDSMFKEMSKAAK